MSAAHRVLLLRAWRLGVLLAIALSVHHQAAAERIGRATTVPGLREVQALWPAVASVGDVRDEAGGWPLLGWDGEPLGRLLSSSPVADHVTGYAGPSEVWLALTGEARVVAARLRDSADTREHVADVRSDRALWAAFDRRPATELVGATLAGLGLDGVSGATRTSAAVVESVGVALAAAVGRSLPRRGGVSFGGRDLALIGLTGLGLLLAWRPGWLRRRRRMLRRLTQLLCVVVLGVVFADLLAWSLFGAWLQHGLPWRAQPGLVLLAAAALLVPWATGRSVYCAHLCPHGAVQEGLGRLIRWQVRLPRGLHRALAMLPALLAVELVLALLLGLPVDLAGVEAFDGWLLGAAALGSLVLLGVGLAASLAVPMAYCRYGCPTGALLKVFATGRGDRLGRRDLGLSVILLLAVAGSVWREPLRAWLALGPLGSV